MFSAAEVFRFLRDMALDIPMTQSNSLLQVKDGLCNEGTHAHMNTLANGILLGQKRVGLMACCG